MAVIGALPAGRAAIMAARVWGDPWPPWRVGTRLGWRPGPWARRPWPCRRAGLRFDAEIVLPLVGGVAVVAGQSGCRVDPDRRHGLRPSLGLAFASGLGSAVVGQLLPGIVAHGTAYGVAGAVLAALFLLAGLLGVVGS